MLKQAEQPAGSLMEPGGGVLQTGRQSGPPTLLCSRQGVRNRVMTNRERILAILNYESYDRMPVVHFGFLPKLIERWVSERHLTKEEAVDVWDCSAAEDVITERLGFDCAYHNRFGPNARISPTFEHKVVEDLPDGFRKVQNAYGAIILQKDGAGSIPAEVDHVLKSRKEWEQEFLPRLQYSDDRLNNELVKCSTGMVPFGAGGREYLLRDERDIQLLLHCGSLYGALRDYMGIENLCYLLADDEPLLDEMIEVNADLCYRCALAALESGVKWDIGHFWEDIAFKNGPLVNPSLFRRKVGPHYKRITDLMRKYGIDLVSLDCDGCIDALVPIWLDNGVNVMFPMEVGTWGASIKPWREKYGREVRGVGGMAKRIFGYDYAAVDAEIERLKPLVELGGYIPCPDHRISDDAKWENVQYYCDRMRQVFG
ncbi:MAG: uroporphyrinogen decarboxylase family protein [Armatimonadota bacterium]|nr:uroporphyrinogen decarboxylase family protein [Armatimonadota bacterium]